MADTPGADDRPFRQAYVQVGAFAERDNATKLAGRLKLNGFQNSFVLTVGRGREALHRVRIGPLASAEQFDAINDGLRSLGVNESRLVIGD